MDITETEINGLTVDIYKPKKEQKGTIVMSAGYGGSRKSPHRIKRAMKFAENGFRAIAYDYRSFTTEKQTKTMTEDLNDLLSVIKHCNCKVGLFGDSWGGFLSIHAAVRSNMVKTVVTRVPTIDTANFRKKYIQGGLSDFEKRITSPKMVEDILKYDSYKIAENFHKPVLIFVGKHDETCPPEYARKFLALVKGEKKLVEFDEGHNFFEGEPAERVTSESLAWFNRYLKEKP